MAPEPRERRSAERERETQEEVKKDKAEEEEEEAEKRGGRCTHRAGIGGDRGIAWWQNARCRGRGSGGPRGRLKVAAGPHARLSHAYTHAYPRIAHARGIHTSLQHGRVHGCARARCSVGHGRVCVRMPVGNVRARSPAS